MIEHIPSPGEKLGPWTCLSTRPVYENPWIKLREDQVLCADGSPGIYGVVHFRNLAVAVVPVDRLGRVILVGQYRYPLRRYSWELPEGGCPEGEDPLVSAARELREETGYSAARWDDLGSVALSNSATDEIGRLYLARDLTEGAPDPDGTEELEVKAVAWEEAYRFAMEGSEMDVMTVAALARARHFLDREREREPAPSSPARDAG